MADFEFKVRGVKRRRVNPRKLATGVIVVAVAIVAIRQREAVLQVVSAMSRGALAPLVAAGAFESVRIVSHAMAYTRSFRTVGYDVPLRATVPAWFKAVFMNTVLPSGGTSGLAAVIDTARARGVPVGSATTGTIFTQTCFYTAMMLVIVAGFFVMGRSGSLHVRDVLVGSVVGVAACAFILLLGLGHLKPSLLQRIMRSVERLVRRVCRKLRVKEPAPWADGLVRSFSAAATELSRRPRQASTVLASMVVAMAFDALAFIASGFAFGITALDALFGGYVTALVFNSFNVTPGGVGIVEGLAAAVLSGYGFPGTMAISAVLTYRAFMYWIPFAVGGVAMRLTQAFGPASESAPAEKTATERGGGREVEGEGGGSEAARSVGAAGHAHRRSRHDAPTPEEVDATVAAAAERVAPPKRRDEPVYVQHRRSRVPVRDRLLAFAHDRIESHTVLCALAVALTAAFGLVSAAFPPDPVMVAVAIDHMNLDAPLEPAWLAVASYILILSVPGILIHDQGNWVLGIAGLLFLGIVTGLTAHGVPGMALVVASLLLMVKWQSCFTGHDFLRSVGRLTVVLFYAAAVALLFVLLGAVAARESIAPDPGYPGTVWLGMQALVTAPGAEGLDVGGAASWYFSSARALALTFTVCVAFVVALLAVRRAVLRRDPAYIESRARARAAAEAAAVQRRELRRALRAETAVRRREQMASLSQMLRSNVEGFGLRVSDAVLRRMARVKDAAVAWAHQARDDVAARRAARRDEDVLEGEGVVVEEVADAEYAADTIADGSDPASTGSTRSSADAGDGEGASGVGVQACAGDEQSRR